MPTVNCLKCNHPVELPDGHNLNVCPACGAVQDKVRAALAVKAATVAAPPEPDPPPPPPSLLIDCATCTKPIARVALVCPHCGAPNAPAQRAAERRKPKYWGGIAIILAIAAWFAPYFAAVFLAPIALVVALIAIVRNEAIAGLVALALTILAGMNIASTSQKISATHAEMERIQEKLRRDLDAIQRQRP